MVICQFFLKGICKFGDNCRNEHRKPDQRGSYNKGYNNYNQGYHDQRGYHNDRGGFGGSKRGGGDRNYDRNYGGGHQHDNNFGGDQGRGGHGNYNDSYGGNRGGGRNPYRYDARESGNHNRYSALSHQADPELPSFNQRSHGRTNSSSQNTQTADHKLERIRKEIREWDDSGQWPFSCYAVQTDEPCFAGLVDISPEEMRDGAYRANSSGNTASYTESLQRVMESYIQKKRELASMSVATLQQEMSKSRNDPVSTTGLFGNIASSASTVFGQNQTSLFGSNSPLVPPTTSSSPGGLFGSSSQSMSVSGPFASSVLQLATASQPAGPFGSSSGPFSSSSGANQETTSLFGITQPTTPSTRADVVTTSSCQETVVAPSLTCSEQDMKAFKQDYFVLGAIPECPPPPELC